MKQVKQIFTKQKKVVKTKPIRKINKSNWLFILAIFLIASNSFGQLCEDFNDKTTTPLIGDGGCSLVTNFGLLDNWGGTNIDGINYQDVGSIGGPGDFFLHSDDGSCGGGGSYIYNNVDFNGNWIAMVPQEQGCFCFDIRLFSQNAGTYNGNTLKLLNNGSTVNSTVIATFVLSIPVDISRGWIRVCAPVALSDSAGNLPSNGDGQWVINTSNPADWDNLITNIGGIGFGLDIGSGDEKFGYDNICLSELCDSTLVDDPPTEEGAFCCDVEIDSAGNLINPNLVVNGNFEYGNTGFMSAYSQTVTTYPGEYDVTNTAAAFGATITDHSFCEDSTLYATNDMFMVVNGKTQQSGSSIIWEQNITGLEEGKEYKMCANFKDMEQCTFNILPRIKMYAGSNVVAQTINTDDTNPCDWERLEICFTATGSSINLKIELDETGNGDGNDLAIDDIALQQKLDPNYFLTVQHQGNNNTITGSLNTMGIGDDDLLSLECETQNLEDYYWFVYETLTPTNPQLPYNPANVVPGTLGWASNIIGGGPANPLNTPWALTTTFPNYQTFDSNKFYVIGMYVPSCCESCYTEKWMYQITYNNRTNQEPISEEFLTDELKVWLKSKFVPNNIGSFSNTKTTANSIANVDLYPNPAKDILNVSIKGATIKTVIVTTLTGQTVSTKHVNSIKTTINVENLINGVYIVTIIDENNKQYSTKFIKK